MQQVSFMLLFSAMVSHSAAKAGLEFTMLSKLALNIWSRKKERTNSPNVSPDLHTPTVMHTLTIDIHIFFLMEKLTTKLENVLLSNPEFQTTLQGSTVLYLHSQTSVLFFHLNMQIRKSFALISLRNYRFPVHRSRIICDYK